MKFFLFLLLSVCWHLPLKAQDVPIDEAWLSLNYSAMKGDASEGRPGYGLGIGLHIWQNGSSSLRSGFKYNHLRQWYDTFSADAGKIEKDVTLVIQ